MNRLVVREVPKEAVQVRPFELKPRILEDKTITVDDEDGNKVPKRIVIEHPWPLDPDIARIIGEAKSLAKGLAIRLEDAIFITLHPNEVAWYTTNQGLILSTLGTYHYIYKALTK